MDKGKRDHDGWHEKGVEGGNCVAQRRGSRLRVNVWVEGCEGAVTMDSELGINCGGGGGREGYARIG